MAMAFQAHGRSISLPSRLHPGSYKVEERLNKLKALEDSPSSSSFPSIQARLINLADLYISFTELIQSPSTQQALCSYDQGSLVKEALDASIPLINTCSTARDIVSSLKNHVTDLQSALRRRSGIDTHVASYTGFRKKSKKEINKCLKELKQTEAKSNGFAPLLDADLRVAMIIRVLREVVSIAINVFKSLLLFLSVPLTKTKGSAKWSLFSRFVASGGVILNEVGCVDVAIISLQSSKSGGIDLEAVKRKLRAVDSCSLKLEDGVDTLFRSLVKNRVALLNILTN